MNNNKDVICTWININNDLPSNSECVLICYDDEECLTEQVIYENGAWYYDMPGNYTDYPLTKNRTSHIVAWMKTPLTYLEVKL